MAEDRSTFEIRFDLDKARRDLAKRRREPRDGRRRRVLDRPMRPGIQRRRSDVAQKGLARDALLLSLANRRKERERDRKDKRERRKAQNELGKGRRGARFGQSLVRALPAVGGAMSLLVANAERIGPVAKQVPGLKEAFKIPGVGDYLEDQIQNLQELKVNISTFGTTFAQASALARSFGVIGQTPPEKEALELIPALFNANRAQALFQSELTEATLNQSTSMWTKLAKRTAAQMDADMFKKFNPLSNIPTPW